MSKTIFVAVEGKRSVNKKVLGANRKYFITELFEDVKPIVSGLTKDKAKELSKFWNECEEPDAFVVDVKCKKVYF